jgi:hypothetical protein
MTKTILLSLSILLLKGSISGFQNNVDTILKRSIVPIIKVGGKVGPEGWILKYPVGTAFLICDSVKYPNRMFLVTARHVIENDSVTVCLINFSDEESISGNISYVRKYVINRNEWKFHPEDPIESKKSTHYSGYDIAVTELYIFRIQLENQKIWQIPLNLDWFRNNVQNKFDSANILAFPFVNRINWERGLTLGQLEFDKGIIVNTNISNVFFDKDKNVKDLNELLIENPKYRPGYSGGIVFQKMNSNNPAKIRILGMAMGMSEIKNNGEHKYCLGFFVKPENIIRTLENNFFK